MDDPHRARFGTFDYAGATHGHRRRLIRHAHRRRFELALQLLEPGLGDRILDFGCGDGFFLDLLRARATKGLRIAGYEPMDYLRERLEGRADEIYASPEQMAGLSFDRIACLEVLEHLTAPALGNVLALLERLLAPEGLLVVSVPIEIGPPALGKYLASRLLTGSDRRCSAREVFRMTVGARVPRENGVEFLPHKGFDHRELKRTLALRFRIEREIHSPLRGLGAWANSQVLWSLRARSGSRPLNVG